MVNTKKFNLHLNYDLLLPIFLLTLLSSGVQYWIAVNEGKDGTVPALKQLFFIFVGYAGMFLASRLSQKFIWKGGLVPSLEEFESRSKGPTTLRTIGLRSTPN